MTFSYLSKEFHDGFLTMISNEETLYPKFEYVDNLPRHIPGISKKAIKIGCELLLNLKCRSEMFLL